MGDLDVGFQNGSISLEAIPAVYYSGQTINGSVIFDLRTPLTFTSLCIQYLGEVNVLWTETETETVNGVKRQRETKFQSHEVYFNDMETLAGGYGVTQLPHTRQTFPFNFQIPFTSPSSFSGEYGSVSYCITATMVYPDMRREQLKKEFTVVAPLDLNKGSPAIKEPTELVFADDAMSCCICFWSSHSVTVRIKLPVTGYCPGQVIPAEVEVENCSGVEIIKIIFEIITRELYRSQQPPSEYIPPEKVLSITERGAVTARTTKSFICDIPVPDMIAANLENCTVIDVGYFFRATFKLSGCNSDLQDEAEICLGLVPINELIQTRYIHPMAHCLPSGPIPDPPSHGEVNLNLSCQNLSKHQDNPPPYPGVANYPTYDKEQQSTNKPIGEIGFVTPQRLSACDMPDGNPPPYPGGNIIGSGYPHPGSGGINIPMTSYPPGGFFPSAPPQ